MKRKTFAALFFSTHILFIVLIIHKQNRFISLSYEKQKKERVREELHEKKKLLTQQYHAHVNPSMVKDFAKSQLRMEPVALSQVRKLNQ
jgi:hypothetical protein